MALITVDAVSKAFRIPSVRRDTIREHLFGILQPRRFNTLQALEIDPHNAVARQSLTVLDSFETKMTPDASRR